MHGAANEAQNKLLMEHHAIFSDEYKVQRFKLVRAECLLVIFPHLNKSHIYIFCHQIKWRWLLLMWKQQPLRSLPDPSMLSKHSDCQLSHCMEFPYRALPLLLLTPAWFRCFRKSGCRAQFRCSVYLFIIFCGISSWGLLGWFQDKQH